MDRGAWWAESDTTEETARAHSSLPQGIVHLLEMLSVNFLLFFHLNVRFSLSCSKKK